MNISKLYIAAALIALCASCTKNEEAFTPEIGGESTMVISTRSGDGTTTTSWADGTELMLNSTLYTYNSVTGWGYTTPLEWGEESEIERLDGYIVKDGASYAAITLGVTDATIDQTAGLDEFDYLYYVATDVVKPDDALSIDLDHMMAQVIVTITSSSSVVEGVTIESPTSMTLSSEDYKWSASDELLDVAAYQDSASDGVYQYTAYVVPRTWSSPEIALSISGSVDATVAKYTSSITLESGKIYNIKVAIAADGTATVVSTVNVSDWGTTTDLGTTTAVISWDGTIAEGFGGGDGTSADSPYLINTPAQLAYLAKAVNDSGSKSYGRNTYYKLNADMSLAGHDWTPIGDSTDDSFAGNFDGGGHTISGLTINSSSCVDIGLFGRLINYATISDLTIKDATIKATIEISTAGFIVGYINKDTTISDCKVIGGTIENGDVKISSAGGIAGSAYSTENYFTNCHVDGATITTGTVIGGITGTGSNVNTYTACSVNATLTTSSTLGGIIGNDKTSGSGAILKGCYTTGEYNGKTAGGIAGIFNGTATGCYSVAEITPKSSGTVGIIYASTTACTLTSCYPTNEIGSESITGSTILSTDVDDMNTAISGDSYKYEEDSSTDAIFPYLITAID
ncbi:MAG: fimbrillin family protein [Rikenellaceae bacterium]